MNAKLSAENSSRLCYLAPELAFSVVSVARNIGLVVGDNRVIRTVADGPAPLHPNGWSGVGRYWTKTVDASARHKVELLLDARRA